ncbi:hypothetical protein J4Q44_G00059660 [Coregonus suidteri]|uniref:Uncharacterized protein n=1 Tax=Coregonus suidteri TaxID=861788 RepID=A0AAN8MBF5_9TELE
MAKNSSSKKSLKSLFSKSEANLTDSVDKEKDDGGRKKFKLFKFKKKRKPNEDEEKQVVVGAAETNESGGDAQGRDADNWPDVSDTKKTRSLTAPRSKVS